MGEPFIYYEADSEHLPEPPHPRGCGTLPARGPGAFLDDTKVKNFITCFKDVTFLTFFFTRLERNRSGRYEREFPFVSRCGAERNLLRCEHRPIVFTRLLPPDASSSASSCSRRAVLSFCGGGERLAAPLRPEALVMLPENGRLYHPAPGRAGGAGPVRSALALEWGSRLEYEQGPEQPPTHFWWEGKRYRLTGELVQLLRGGEGAGEAESGGAAGRG
ncbi:UPF0598 protein C8orf82 homolog [Colius striatus]|uniref:UPF0598 protein C8orf82 homolog n=1 Tax=Colius striatus TaxID=57412 RepID=UPI002B1E223D|nr:UPF0598 protein C8orf82 homolog [Colius striatus]